MDLSAFALALNKHLKLEDEDSPYDVGRTTHCHLVYFHKGKPHIFQVRGWTYHANKSMLSISVVNWTMCAGTASLELKEENVKDWLILEDNPALEVLVGNN